MKHQTFVLHHFRKILPFIPYKKAWVYTIVVVAMLACNSPYVPRQEGYFRIDFPEKKYVEFNEAGYPYTFEYPAYGNIVKDSLFFDSTAENPYWINIHFPQFDGRIYISYKNIGRYQFQQLINDAYKMTGKHTIKASGINDSVMHPASNVSGTFFQVEGNVATASQFFLTDSTRHFLRGALYFDATPNEDSLRPVNEFLTADMKHLINTFRWK